MRNARPSMNLRSRELDQAGANTRIVCLDPARLDPKSARLPIEGDVVMMQEDYQDW